MMVMTCHLLYFLLPRYISSTFLEKSIGQDGYCRSGVLSCVQSCVQSGVQSGLQSDVQSCVQSYGLRYGIQSVRNEGLSENDVQNNWSAFDNGKLSREP